jgi:hypothetical protein
MKQYRQGDVFLLPVDEKRVNLATARPLDHVTIALGEATGHAHRFDASTTHVHLLRDSSDTLWIKVEQPSPLVHEEHETLLIEPGLYRYLPQREYDPLANRWVVD